MRRLAGAAGLWLALLASGWAGLQVYILEPAREDETEELVLVERESRRDGTAVLVEPGGLERTIPEKRILARVTPAPGPGEKANRETALAAINALLEAKARAAALERTLQEEVEKWKKVLDAMPGQENGESLAKARAELDEFLGRALPQSHSPTFTYTEGELNQRLGVFAEARSRFPSLQGEIDQRSEPWRLEKAEMDAGKKKLEGRWLNPEDWEREKGARQKAAREAFLAKLEIPEVSSVLVSQGILLAFVAVGLLGAFLGASFLFHGVLEIGRHRAWWKGTGWILAGLALVAVLVRAAGLAMSEPATLETEGPGDAAAVEELFWRHAGEKKPFPRELRIGAADLNAWFGKRLRFSAPKVTEILVVSAESWKLGMQDGCLRLDRTGNLLGRKFVLRHEMTFHRSEQGEDVYRIEATLGKLPLPPALVIRSWNQWTGSIAKMTAAIGAAEHLSLERIEKGAAVFSGN